MVSEMISRLIATFFVLISILGMGLELSIDMSILPLIIFIGIGIFAVGGGAFTYALLIAKNANISLFFYLVPISAVAWLVIFGESLLTVTMIVGGLITIGACVYLMYDNSQKTQNPAT
jgi:drug/metabolite transporter (DMT)-like permease